jgi:hypothetical protein
MMGSIFLRNGANPLLDPYYSSSHFRIQHQGCGMTRFEKTALVADWPLGLNSLLVCQSNDVRTSQNCGTCEKCIRTMTALVALGKLAHCEAFPSRDVSEELLDSVEQYEMIKDRATLNYFLELVPYLSQCGRDDLAQRIRQFEHLETERTKPQI